MLRSRKLEDVQEKTAAAIHYLTNGAWFNYIIYLDEKTPKELAGYRFSRLKKGSREWVEETANVNIPGAVRYVSVGDGNVLVFPWIQRIKIAPDRTLLGFGETIRVVNGALRTPYGIYFLRSTDNGHTWNFLSEIPYQPDKERDKSWDKPGSFYEPNITFVPLRWIGRCLLRPTLTVVGHCINSRSTDNREDVTKPVVSDDLGVVSCTFDPGEWRNSGHPTADPACISAPPTTRLVSRGGTESRWLTQESSVKILALIQI